MNSVDSNDDDLQGISTVSTNGDQLTPIVHIEVNTHSANGTAATATTAAVHVLYAILCENW